MRITKKLLNFLFEEEGLRFTHDDEMRPDADYYWVSSDRYPGVCLRVYFGAESGGNLINRYSVNDQYVSGILCLDTAVLNYDFDENEVKFESTVAAWMMCDDLLAEPQYPHENLYIYLHGTPCVAYVDQENVTDYGYLNFVEDLTSISNVADLMYRQLADAVA